MGDWEDLSVTADERLLVVDDSVSIGRLVQTTIGARTRIGVCGAAADSLGSLINAADFGKGICNRSFLFVGNPNPVPTNGRAQRNLQHVSEDRGYRCRRFNSQRLPSDVPEPRLHCQPVSHTAASTRR